MKRLGKNGDYLLLAPNMIAGGGYHHMLSERSCLVDNIQNFLKTHEDVEPHAITLYELRSMNGNIEL